MLRMPSIRRMKHGTDGEAQWPGSASSAAKGAWGTRWSQAIAAAGHECAGGVDKGGDVAALADRSDVLVDFSAPAALEANLHAAIGAGMPILVGTTGLDERHHAAIDGRGGRSRCSRPATPRSASLCSPTWCARRRRGSAPDWDIEIVEMHHRMKVDAPSGTALLLGEAAARRARDRARRVAASAAATASPARASRGAIGFASLRGGTVAGDHSVIFAGEGERLSCRHRAESRAIFARGAVRGARCGSIGKPAGPLHDGATCSGLSERKADDRRILPPARRGQPRARDRARISSTTIPLLVAVVLSAQATDAGVNLATRELFATVDDARSRWSRSARRGSSEHIKTIGLFNTKAKNVIALSRGAGRASMAARCRADRDALAALPGVGRKTANVVMNCAFGAETFAVDTHVFRVANRTGLAPGKTPERGRGASSRSATPQPFRRHAHHWLILHGRYVCKARHARMLALPGGRLVRLQGEGARASGGRKRADHLRGDEVADHVERRAAHVEEAVDAEDQADALGRHADAGEDQRDHRQRAAGHARGADAGEDAHQHHEQLIG